MWKMYFATIVAACRGIGAAAEEPAKVDFARDVQPLFRAHCTGCHGPKQQKNGFRLDRRRDAFRGGVANQIAPGNSEASHLYFRLIGSRGHLQMEVLRDGDRAAFRKLRKEEPSVAKRKGPNGSTPLMYATLYGDAESVRLLLEAGAEDGRTPLLIATAFPQLMS